MAIITAKPRTAFIHIPKCAGTSISKWLQKHARGEKHGGKHSKMHEHPSFGDSRFIFTCVRNPYDWVLSAWKYMVANDGRSHLVKGVTLDDWVFGEVMFTHMCGVQQHEYIDINRIDYIMKYENLHNDFKKIQGIFKVDVDMDYLNKSKYKPDVLTDDMKDKIANHYHKDFELFGYNI